MIVVIGGMYRSGSTYTFNIVRELLSVRGGAHVAAVDSLDKAFAEPSDKKHLVIKSHAPDFLCTRLIERGVLPCVCTFRKPEDAVASYVKAFGFDLESAVSVIRDWLKWHQTVSPYVLNISYETIDRHPLRAILGIQTYLLGRPRLVEALRLQQKYDKRRVKDTYDNLQEGDTTKNIGFSYYDEQTFFHRRHIASLDSTRADGELNSEDLAMIHAQLKDFIDSNGHYQITNTSYRSGIKWINKVFDLTPRGAW